MCKILCVRTNLRCIMTVIHFLIYAHELASLNAAHFVLYVHLHVIRFHLLRQQLIKHSATWRLVWEISASEGKLKRWSHLSQISNYWSIYKNKMYMPQEEKLKHLGKWTPNEEMLQTHTRVEAQTSGTCCKYLNKHKCLAVLVLLEAFPYCFLLCFVIRGGQRNQ